MVPSVRTDCDLTEETHSVPVEDAKSLFVFVSDKVHSSSKGSRSEFTVRGRRLKKRTILWHRLNHLHVCVFRLRTNRTSVSESRLRLHRLGGVGDDAHHRVRGQASLV